MHIQDNQDHGIFIASIWDLILKMGHPKENHIYENNFYNNGRRPRCYNGFEFITLFSSNHWDIGEKGNYWHDSAYRKYPKLYDSVLCG